MTSTSAPSPASRRSSTRSTAARCCATTSAGPTSSLRPATGLMRRLDALGIDTQYPCGIPGSLGTPAETIDMMGMYEAFADRKPVWGMEIYIQPRFPAPMPATQVWGFVAHGMDVVNNFAWKPYSDAGLKAKRWNEEGAPPWWVHHRLRRPAHAAVRSPRAGHEGGQPLRRPLRRRHAPSHEARCRLLRPPPTPGCSLTSRLSASGGAARSSTPAAS